MARLIDADALEGYVLTQCSWYDNRDEDEAYAAVADAPTVNAEPVRRGKWMQDDTRKDLYFCSACIGRDHRNKPKHKYCPDCGAIMTEVTP